MDGRMGKQNNTGTYEDIFLSLTWSMLQPNIDLAGKAYRKSHSYLYACYSLKVGVVA